MLLAFIIEWCLSIENAFADKIKINSINSTVSAKTSGRGFTFVRGSHGKMKGA